MRILYASERPPYPFFLGGAARSAHYLMSILAKDHGVECRAVGSKAFRGSNWSSPDPEDYAALGITDVKEAGDRTTIRCAYTVEVLDDFNNALARTIEEFAPDVVWTQLDGIESVARIAHTMGAKVLVFLRDAEDSPKVLKSLAALGCCLVCNSHFMAQRVKGITGKRARVIYPSLEASFVARGDPHGFLTMINPHRVKGVDTFIEIAKRLPSENFLLVESWTLDETALSDLQDKLAILPNVRLLRRVPDVQEIYRQTKLLLVPSVWEEAFGRVVIEAQSCRIPVIASQRGGLPESVGRGGICLSDYLNADAWVAAIQDALRSDDTYEALAQEAYAHATSETFTTRYAARRFIDVCTDESCYVPPGKFSLHALLGLLRARH
jgi:glycosyltransferase involved in cell wall biosynthesis